MVYELFYYNTTVIYTRNIWIFMLCLSCHPDAPRPKTWDGAVPSGSKYSTLNKTTAFGCTIYISFAIYILLFCGVCFNSLIIVHYLFARCGNILK